MEQNTTLGATSSTLLTLVDYGERTSQHLDAELRITRDVAKSAVTLFSKTVECHIILDRLFASG
jgi:hypothetical protein